MAQEWDEKKDEEIQPQEVQLLLEFLDENTKEKLMKKVIKMLERNNIDFKVEGDKIMIKGLAVYFEPAGYMGSGTESIEIIDGDKKILWETNMSRSRISVGTIGTPGYTDSVELPRIIYADYNLPYLTIVFYSPKLA
jgi:hypothetical protein